MSRIGDAEELHQSKVSLKKSIKEYNSSTFSVWDRQEIYHPQVQNTLEEYRSTTLPPALDNFAISEFQQCIIHQLLMRCPDLHTEGQGMYTNLIIHLINMIFED